MKMNPMNLSTRALQLMMIMGFEPNDREGIRQSLNRSVPEWLRYTGYGRRTVAECACWAGLPFMSRLCTAAEWDWIEYRLSSDTYVARPRLKRMSRYLPYGPDDNYWVQPLHEEGERE